jgi:hypothetical protein
MVDHVYASQDLAQAVRVTHIAHHKFDFLGEVAGTLAVGMNLGGEVIEDADRVSGSEKSIGKM